MLPLAARTRATIVLMHMQGLPQTMQDAPAYVDVVAEVSGFLKIRSETAIRTGIEPHRILLDVGIGFGKSLEHNLQLIKNHALFASLGLTFLVNRGVTVPKQSTGAFNEPFLAKNKRPPGFAGVAVAV